MIQVQHQQELPAQMAGLAVAVLVLYNLQIEMVAQEIRQLPRHHKATTVEMAAEVALIMVAVVGAGVLRLV